MVEMTTALRSVVGDKTAKALATGFSITTVGELLYHFPRRHAQRGEHTALSRAFTGEQVTVLAQVLRVNRRPMRQRRGSLLEVVVGDQGRSTLTLTFFNQAWREKELTPGRWGLFAGKVGDFRGTRQLQHPEYQLLAHDSDSAASEVEEFAGALIPVYPATAAVPSWVIARCVQIALTGLAPIVDPLPKSLRAEQGLIELDVAIRDMHRPSSTEALAAARHRLAFDEAFALQVVLAQRRAAVAAKPATAWPARSDGLAVALDAAIPFELTAGQRDVGDVIAAELAGNHPMHRLLQGEVGSGKTIVAVRAMAQVVAAGGQAALLAPTEVLAAQHERSIKNLLGDLGIAGELGAADEATSVVLLTGSLSAPRRRAALAAVKSGAAGIVVGTHALLSEGVQFANLGLVIVDEQHRFGVEQRDALRAKGARPPHVLVMTATPIPRTVAMTVFGDLEVSALTQLPAGRSTIATTVVPVAEKPAWLDRVWQRIREEVSAGHQAYVVFPRIGVDAAEDADLPEDDESAGTRRPPLAVLDIADELRAGPLSGLNVAILHGRMSPEEKDAVMADFAAGEADVLLATTIVEVGVDVPNSTVMVIMDADRFGVSQLHQLRGRVGRGSAAGVCLLVTEAMPDTPARERLDNVAATVDGFRLAELDLAQRREGDVLGSAQSGRRSQLKVLSLLRDAAVIDKARTAASALVAADPDLAAHPELASVVAALVADEQAEYLEKT